MSCRGRTAILTCAQNRIRQVAGRPASRVPVRGRYRRRPAPALTPTRAVPIEAGWYPRPVREERRGSQWARCALVERSSPVTSAAGRVRAAGLARTADLAPGSAVIASWAKPVLEGAIAGLAICRRASSPSPYGSGNGPAPPSKTDTQRRPGGCPHRCPPRRTTVATPPESDESSTTAGATKSGSDGTRTRDLRRDRPAL